MSEDPKTRETWEAPRRDLVVTGLHRSGTTFVGHVLRRAGYFQVFEPMNRQYGSRLVDRWKPHPDTSTADGMTYRDVLARVVEGPVVYRNTLQSSNPLKRLVGRAIGMNRVALRYRLGLAAQRVRNRPRLFKDPDMLFCAEELSRQHACDVIILVRHPCAFHASVKRLGWRFPLEDLFEQEALVTRYWSHLREHFHGRPRSFAEESALVWLLAHSVVRDQLAANPNLILVRHEDLAARPMVVFRRLCRQLEIPFTASMSRRILSSTQGRRVQARGNRATDLVRDSRALAGVWQTRLDPDEIKTIRELVAPIFGDFYDTWLPEDDDGEVRRISTSGPDAP